MAVWPVQHAKARFSELLNACQREGPQVVSRRGTEAAVLVPIEQWHRLQAAPDLLDLDLQLAHRRLSGGPSRGHPFPGSYLQTPIGSLPLTGSASRRAMPLGSWMSRQSRLGPMNSMV